MGMPPITGRLAVREAIIINRSGPWLPWLAPVTLGVLDAVNVIGKVALPLYVGLIVIAATVTTLALGPRIVCDLLAERWERAAEQAPIGEAALFIYQAAAEHLEARQEAAEELPQAVGENTERLSRGLHVVRPPAADIPAARGQSYRRKTSVGRATVPQQAQPAPQRHLASARPPQL
jgi:hypothetical protein